MANFLQACLTFSMGNLDRFNKLRKNEAAQELIEICSCLPWIEGLVKNRPINSLDDLLLKAESNWKKLSTKAKQEAVEENLKNISNEEKERIFAQHFELLREKLTHWAQN